MNFKQFIEAERRKINEKYLKEYIESFLDSESEPDLQKILKSAHEFILSGGRRLLPISLIQTFKGIASDKMLVEFSDEIYRASISIEMLHISNLIIEDMVDQESHREGSLTVYGLIKKILAETSPEKGSESNPYFPLIINASTIYEGNIIGLLGFDVLLRTHFPRNAISKAQRIYHKGMIDLSRGRLLNEYYKMINLEKISLEDYLILAGLKRGSQRAAAAGIGAALCNGRKSQWQPLSEAMNFMGIIEQLINDKLGIKSDIRTGQLSILPIIAYQSATDEQKDLMRKIIGNPSADEDQIERIVEIYQSTGAIDFIIHYANSLKNNAYNKLMAIYPGLRDETVEFFEEFLTYLINYRG